MEATKYIAKAIQRASLKINYTSEDDLCKLIFSPSVIEAEEVVFGENITIGCGVHIKAKRLYIGSNTTIYSNNIIIADSFNLGSECIVQNNSVIKGTTISIGDRTRILHDAEIGGGSCLDPWSELVVGNDCYIGSYTHINIARKVSIGDEVGIGRGTCIFTHAAYLSSLDGFPVKFAPVQIGNRVWIPGATINPGVVIGDNCVIGVGSVVTKNIPEGSFAAGTPATVRKYRQFPANLDIDSKVEIIAKIVEIALQRYGLPYSVDLDRISGICFEAGEYCISVYRTFEDGSLKPEKKNIIIVLEEVVIEKLDRKLTIINLFDKIISGFQDEFIEKLRQQFRRNGVRLLYE